MKKYSVYDLYVVSVKKETASYKFICRKSLFNDCSYIEILTGENIVQNSRGNIQPLASFYPPIATHDIKSGEPLKLDKSDILRKYIDINSESIIKRDNISYDNNSLLNVDELLDKAIDNVFPEKGNWGSDCFERPDTVGISYIPCHSRDDEWMAKLIRQINELYFISLNRIISYVKNSDYYKEKRHQYELEVVRWQIKWMVNGGENWIVEDEYGGDFIYFDENCDIGFRRGIVNTLTRIGMDKEVIEEGIEKNASMWRDRWMSSAFRNNFEPILGLDTYRVFSNHDSISQKVLPPVSDELKEKWMRLRKYDYYQEHRDSVNKYGIVEDDMKMTDEEVDKLREEVAKMAASRKEEICDFKNQRDEELKQFRKTKMN